MWKVVSANVVRRIGKKYASVDEARKEFGKEDNNSYRIRYGAGSAVVFRGDFVAAKLREQSANNLSLKCWH